MDDDGHVLSERTSNRAHERFSPSLGGLQRVTAGLDTGDVVRNGSVPIGRKSYSRVWREVEELGCQVFIDAVLDMKHGRATLTPQSPQRGPLYRQPSVGDLLRFWLRRLFRRPPAGSQS